MPTAAMLNLKWVPVNGCLRQANKLISINIKKYLHPLLLSVVRKTLHVHSGSPNLLRYQAVCRLAGRSIYLNKIKPPGCPPAK